MRKVRSSYDDGWVGRHIHSVRGREASDESSKMDVHERSDSVLFYSVQDGELYQHWKRDMIGFVRCDR